jgi:hypothetical protein
MIKGKMRELGINQANGPSQENENGSGMITEVPGVLTHSVKIDQTARGCRISVHTYANTGQEAMNEAIKLYQETKTRLKELGEAIAPIEIRSNGEK